MVALIQSCLVVVFSEISLSKYKTRARRFYGLLVITRLTCSVVALHTHTHTE